MKAQIIKYHNVTYQDPGKGGIAKERQDFILKYTPLIHYIAERIAMRLPPSISKQELISAGIVGLLDALEKFDPDIGIQFKTYAEHRIRGAILDELRKMDWIPRSVRKDIHRIEHAIKALQARFGREPRDFEIAQELGLDLDSFFKLLNRARGIGLFSLEDVVNEDGHPKSVENRLEAPSPLDEMHTHEMKMVITKALEGLPQKEQLVMSLYYYEELTLKEISKVMNLTESRISQIHTKAILRLRARLKSYHEGG